MKAISGIAGQTALRRLLAADPLIVFDFDGTLAPLRSLPRTVRLPARTLRLLRRIAACAPLAILSGRKRSDLKRFFPRLRLLLIGNHGLEGGTADAAELRRAHSACHLWSMHIAQLLHERGDDGRIWLEDKTYSLTLHSRSPRALRSFLLRLRRRPSLPAARFLHGRDSVDVLVTAWDKGKALDRLLRKTKRSSALFVGDDATDEDVFALRRRSLLTVRVGRDRKSRAMFMLRSQKNIDTLLGEIAQCLHTSSSPHP